MKFDITWTITAIIAVSSFASPIAVAIINNMHHAKMRKMELEHDEYLRQLNIYYADKKTAFSNVLKAAGDYSGDKQSLDKYGVLHSAVNNALLFCNEENHDLLSKFLHYVDSEVFDKGYTESELITYSTYTDKLAFSLGKELESTKPLTDCKRRK